jgi:hypothetical protein
VNRVVVLLFLASLSGCASYDAAMKSWVGSTEHELILDWGPPTRTASDGSDGRILIYEYDRGGGKVHVNDNGDVTIRAGSVSTRMFYVNGKGVIYSWRWQGL